MADDWLKRFQDLSRAVDVVDDEIFDDITNLLHMSFDAWDVCFCRILISGHRMQTAAGNVSALKTKWSYDPKQNDVDEKDIQIAGDGGRATTITSYAFLHDKSVWIVAKDEGRLVNHTNSSDGLVDQWPGRADLPPLPPYTDYGDGKSRTMAVLPIEYGGRLFGVISLEFSEAIQFSDRSRATADLFASSLARIVWLHETNRVQVRDTQRALQRLRDGHRSAKEAWKRRKIFLACSGDETDGPVVATIDSVLRNDFTEQFDLEPWNKMAESGDINEQVRDMIMGSEFGICYLSEHLPDDPLRYKDNPNVLYEAGMFQMAHEMRDDPDKSDAARWIPVRESRKLSGPVPFDIAGDRLLTVPRNTETGEVDTDELASVLRKRIRELMKGLDID